MQILDTTYPARYFFLFLVGALDRVDVEGSASHHIFALDVLELKHGLVLAVESGFIQLVYT